MDPWSRSPVARVCAGVVAGLAWSAGMRAWMVEIAGDESTFSWVGTFGFVLVPGAVVGGLLGWAARRRDEGPVSRRTRRLLVAAPLLLSVALVDPSNLQRIFTTGEGTGALGIVGVGMLGGYALGGHGRPVLRAVSGAATAALLVAVGAFSAMLAGAGWSARGVWGALLVSSLVGVLCLGCALPHRLLLGDRRESVARVPRWPGFSTASATAAGPGSGRRKAPHPSAMASRSWLNVNSHPRR